MTGAGARGPRIAVVGAYGNGKTTLTGELTRRLGLARTHGRAMRDPLGAEGRSLEDCTVPQLLQLAVRRFTERAVDEALLADGFVSDGSVLHEWVYTKVRLVLGRLPEPPARLDRAPRPPATVPYEEVADQIGLLAKQHVLDGYDLVVHLPAEVPLPQGHRPISEHFRAVSDRLLLDTLEELRCPVHRVTGTLEDRVRQVLGLLASRRG
ncbi:AAA family ATPase [Streptomyces sp. SP17BM10]|uniref:AAA family ATPase n=1 Tax=Streptomyces sp. SP17BM10 TaxID=3002530 RepID=UPI002E7A1817|nr:AAA family ATPase [Streptomyces sp. SP17BM10]MEE1784150.1 AAA family ATPase [Streptomyces sp. SP17BM10]